MLFIVFFLTFFARHGGLAGKVSFALCLVIDVIFFLFIIFVNNGDDAYYYYRAMAGIGLPLLLQMYVLEDLDIAKWDGFKITFLDGSSREWYGVAACVIAAVLGTATNLIFGAKVASAIGIIVGILLHGITVRAFMKKGWPFAVKQVENSSSTNTTSAPKATTSSNHDPKEMIEREFQYFVSNDCLDSMNYSMFGTFDTISNSHVSVNVFLQGNNAYRVNIFASCTYKDIDSMFTGEDKAKRDVMNALKSKCEEAMKRIRQNNENGYYGTFSVEYSLKTEINYMVKH